MKQLHIAKRGNISNTGAIGKFSIGSTVADAAMYDYVLRLLGSIPVGPNGLAIGRSSCPNFFASASISRTYPDTRQRHGAFDGWAPRFF